MPSATERTLKYSIVVPVHNNASGLRKCLAGLEAQTYDHSRFEVFVVDIDSSDDGAIVADQAGVRCLHEDYFRTSYAARNLGIKAARGELIAFLEADCVPHPEWLAHLDTETADRAIGCFAGEILSLESTTAIDQFSEATEPLRQRGPLSGRQFRPYALLANAVYRKAVFESIGLFDPTLTSGGDAALGWRMLDQTDFRIQFVPEAVVYQRRPSNVSELWAECLRLGRSKLNWALGQSAYRPPSVDMLEAELVQALEELVSKLAARENSDEQIMVSLLQSTTQIGRYSGYLQELLKLMSHDAPISNWADVACNRAFVCDICGSRGFVPGPRKRMVGKRAPRCFQCGSLERHRILHKVLGVMNQAEFARWTCLSVGESLPDYLKRFIKTSHVDLARLGSMDASAPWDLVVAMNVLSRSGKRSFENTLATLVGPLRDNGMLILVDSASDMVAGGAAIAYEGRIASHLPNVSVRSSWVPDHVTGATKIVTVASPDVSKVSQIAVRLNRDALIR